MIFGAQTGSFQVQHYPTILHDRFWALLSNIHLADNEKSVDRDHQDYDKLYKIHPMMTILKQSFQINFSLGQNVSVDKAMVKGKGHNPVKQYMPKKPIKWGSKLCCIGCSCCAYIFMGTFNFMRVKRRALQSKIKVLVWFVIYAILPWITVVM